MPSLNHYQQEVGPSLADTKSRQKCQMLPLLEVVIVALNIFQCEEHYEDILDFTLLIRFFSIGPICMQTLFESEEAVRQCLEDYEQSQNPFISLPSEIRLQVRFQEPFTHG